MSNYDLMYLLIFAESTQEILLLLTTYRISSSMSKYC